MGSAEGKGKRRAFASRSARRRLVVVIAAGSIEPAIVEESMSGLIDRKPPT
jgi:hypothetical protein